MKNVDIGFDKPRLDRKSPEANIALIDTWISQTADKLNYLVTQLKNDEE